MKKPLMIVAAIALMAGSAHARNSIDDELGFVAFSQVAKKVCNLTPDQITKVNSWINATIKEGDNSDFFAKYPPSDYSIHSWARSHVSSWNLLYDAENGDEIAHKIVCDNLYASLDSDFPSEPFSYLESGYAKRKTDTCVTGFEEGTATSVNPKDPQWCHPLMKGGDRR